MNAKESFRPLANPAGSLEEFLVKRSRYLERLDQNKYQNYIKRASQDNDFLWQIHDDLLFLENFDFLCEIQGSIKLNRQFGVSVLKVLIPLSKKIDLGNQTELNFLERRTHGRQNI
jgi:hypothetical protein